MNAKKQSLSAGPELLLVSPRQEHKHYSIQWGMARLAGKKGVIPSLALPLLAAHTPPRFRVRIVDEELGPVDTNCAADIVGITALSNSIERAYAVADNFRRRGITVVMGGPHASFAADEALAHADCVVAGEAEGVWAGLLGDFENGRLQKIYKQDDMAPYSTSPVPRWDLVDTRHYLSLPVQATRGCPYGCEFCLVTRMYGRKMRFRDVGDVMREISSLPVRRLFFIDDNLTIRREWARALMAELGRLKLSWGCQASIDIVKDPDLLAAMAAAGCDQMLIGFESLNRKSLNETRKYHNTRADYERAIETIHGFGIHVLGSFIAGFDHDTPDELDNIEQFCRRAGLCFASINLLGANPGTALHDRLGREGRLCDMPPSFKGGMFPAIRYMNMSQGELFDRYVSTLERFFSWENILHKAQKVFGGGTFARKYKDADIGAFRKFLMTMKLLGIFLFSRDAAKRKLFLSLFVLFRKKKIHAGRMAFFLFAMEGMHRSVAGFVARKESFMRVVRRYDTGAFTRERSASPECGSGTTVEQEKTAGSRHERKHCIQTG